MDTNKHLFIAMKKQLFFFIAILLLVSCGDIGTSYELVTAIKTVSKRVNDINKTIPEIKNSEDQLALVIDEPLYLEYEYPMRENESYVVKYRFNASGCFEIKLDTYFNQQNDTRKVFDEIVKDLNVNTTFEETKKGIDFFRWENSNSKTVVELDAQHIERGIISISIFNSI